MEKTGHTTERHRQPSTRQIKLLECNNQNAYSDFHPLLPSSSFHRLHIRLVPMGHNPDQTPRISWVEQMLGNHSLPTIAVSDNIAAVPDLIRPWVDDQFISLGTDGFGRSDLRENLRSHFEIDANHITLNALSLLVKNGEIEKETESSPRISTQLIVT